MGVAQFMATIGEGQVLEIRERRKLSTVVERVDATDRFGMSEFELVQGKRTQFDQSRRVKLQKRMVVMGQHVKHLEIGQRQSSALLVFVVF